MKITKTQLQTIIREEYVKVLFESEGHSISDDQAKMLVEGLDENFFGSLSKAFKAGKEAFSSSRAEDQVEKNEAAVTKAELDVKKEIVKIRQESKDLLKKHGWKGDENDMAVLGVDLFEKAVADVLGLSGFALHQRSRPKKLKPSKKDTSGSIAGLRRGRTRAA